MIQRSRNVLVKIKLRVNKDFFAFVFPMNEFFSVVNTKKSLEAMKANFGVFFWRPNKTLQQDGCWSKSWKAKEAKWEGPPTTQGGPRHSPIALLFFPDWNEITSSCPRIVFSIHLEGPTEAGKALFR